MKRTLISLIFLSVSCVLFSQIKVSILGDSYSTFKGWSPDNQSPWYGPDRGNDVKEVDQTWWKQLIDNNGLQLEVNDSWGGATISNTGYDGKDYTHRAFHTRTDKLGDNPDIIFVFGGTNDSWAGSPIGEWDGKDLYTVRPAIKEMLQNLKKNYPDALYMVIINSELSKEVTEALAKISEEENVPYVQLEYIDKQNGHPSISGMQQINKQVWKATAPLLYEPLKK